VTLQTIYPTNELSEPKNYAIMATSGRKVRFCVGIDLGTSTTGCGYIDVEDPRSEFFEITSFGSYSKVKRVSSS
jgi:hypothetical protein